LLQDFDGPLAAVKSLPGSQKITDDRGSGLRMAHGIRGQSREPCGCRGIALDWPRRAAGRACLVWAWASECYDPPRI